MSLCFLSVIRLDNIKERLPSESSLAIVKGHLHFEQYGENRDPPIFNFFSTEPGEKITTGSLPMKQFLTKQLPLPSFNQVTDLAF